MWTDGSCLDNGACGYSVVWGCCPNDWRGVKPNMGYNQEAFDAECAAIVRPLNLAAVRQQRKKLERVTVFTDAQACSHHADADLRSRPWPDVRLTSAQILGDQVPGRGTVVPTRVSRAMGSRRNLWRKNLTDTARRPSKSASGMGRLWVRFRGDRDGRGREGYSDYHQRLLGWPDSGKTRRGERGRTGFLTLFHFFGRQRRRIVLTPGPPPRRIRAGGRERQCMVCFRRSLNRTYAK